MGELLELVGAERVLEVGTGSGYAAAVLSRLCSHVVTVERHARWRGRRGDRCASSATSTWRYGTATARWAFPNGRRSTASR